MFNKDRNDTELGDKTGFEGWEYTDFVWVMKKIFKNKFRIRKKNKQLINYAIINSLDKQRCYS